jgi:hypothetical protein
LSASPVILCFAFLLEAASGKGGFSLLGDRQIQVAAGDGPEIQIKVYGLFSDVKVTDQPT